MAREVVKRGAPRIDLNCGCPSNTVTGRGAGSSLLKEPEHLYRVAKAMVDAVAVPVTAKLRSGFEDTSLFKDNLLVPALAAFIGTLVCESANVLLYMAFSAQYQFFHALLFTIMPMAIYNTILAPLVYYLLLKLERYLIQRAE